MYRKSSCFILDYGLSFLTICWHAYCRSDSYYQFISCLSKNTCLGLFYVYFCINLLLLLKWFCETNIWKLIWQITWKERLFNQSIALLCLLGGLYFYSIQSDKNVLNDLAFENIEALAFEEGPNENFRRYGWGDIECHGIKVERKTSGFR